MEILYCLPEKDTIMGRWQHDHFIEELSHHNVFIRVFNPLLFMSWDEANDALLIEIKNRRYDIFMSAICDDKLLFESTLSEIKRIGIPTLCIRFDNLVVPLYDKKLSALYDLVWLTSVETKRFYDKWGAKTCFAPYAANPYVFMHKVSHNSIRRVCFVGTPYGSRTRMFNTLTRGGVNLTLFYGNSSFDTIDNAWEHFKTFIDVPSQSHSTELIKRLQFHEGRVLIRGAIKNKIMGKCFVENNSHLVVEPAVAPSRLSSIYSEYVLSLASSSAHHTDVLKTPLKIVNLRNFEIPMSGGVEFCRYNTELAEYFEEDKEIIFYRSKEEMIDKALYYTNKATDNEVYQIRCAARVRSEKEHTWYLRFKKILNELEFNI